MATDDVTPSRTQHKLPGFGLPLDFIPSDASPPSLEAHPIIDWGPLFPNALELSSERPLTTLREFYMMRFMNQVTDKANWDTKLFDEKIVSKWKKEALSAPSMDMTERMFDYCIDELRYKSKRFKESGFISVYDGDVVKSDTAIPSSLQVALREAVAPLEDVPVVHRDWHPGSNETVLDLVHPSLFPVVYGRTRILRDGIVGLGDCIKRCGEGETLSVQDNKSQRNSRPPNSDLYSRKFQWLPCEVKFNDEKATITSYINNLHPVWHKPLYGVIEKIIDLTIPLWDQTLSNVGVDESFRLRLTYEGCSYDPDPERLPEDEQPQRLPGESEDNYYDRKDQWFQDNRKVVLPEPDPFVPRLEEATYDLREEFSGKGLQVIVKLANVHLTPEKPDYEGGTWHVEGQLNEHICATALYYYDSSNITDSYLSFRQQSSITDAHDVHYEQDHHDWLWQVYGCEQDGPGVEEIGDILTKEGRLITFPNIFQHRLCPFSLSDKTKPGHRKILALFLVDPHITIISSAHVPCQQKDWWTEELREQHVFPKIPVEILKEVSDMVDEFPIGMDEAKSLRLELMNERKNFVREHNNRFHSDTFSLCEH